MDEYFRLFWQNGAISLDFGTTAVKERWKTGFWGEGEGA
jgi:hypothetical protein